MNFRLEDIPALRAEAATDAINSEWAECAFKLCQDYEELHHKAYLTFRVPKIFRQIGRHKWL